MLLVRCVALVFLMPALAQATAPQRVVWEGYGDFSAGKCRSTSLTEDGVLSPAPLSRKWADLNVEEAWSILALPDGSVIVGTAPEGKLLRVGPRRDNQNAGEISRVTYLRAGCRPPWRNFRGHLAQRENLSGERGGEKCRSISIPARPTSGRWRSRSTEPLFAGTGTKGRIYRVTARGKGELWYASNETHIRSLGFDLNGALLAGSAPSGYLYKISGKNQAVVLDDTGHEEINQLLTLPDHTVCFTATGAAKAAGAPDNVLKKAQGSGSPPTDVGTPFHLVPFKCCRRSAASLDHQGHHSFRRVESGPPAAGFGGERFSLFRGAAWRSHPTRAY